MGERMRNTVINPSLRFLQDGRVMLRIDLRKLGRTVLLQQFPYSGSVSGTGLVRQHGPDLFQPDLSRSFSLRSFCRGSLCGDICLSTVCREQAQRRIQGSLNVQVAGHRIPGLLHSAQVGNRGIRINRASAAIGDRQRSTQLQRPAAVNIAVCFLFASAWAYSFPVLKIGVHEMPDQQSHHSVDVNGMVESM